MGGVRSVRDRILDRREVNEGVIAESAVQTVEREEERVGMFKDK